MTRFILKIFNPLNWLKVLATIALIPIFLAISIGIGDYAGGRENAYYEGYRRLATNIVNISLARIMPVADRFSKKIEESTPVYKNEKKAKKRVTQELDSKDNEEKEATFNLINAFKSMGDGSYALLKIVLCITVLIFISPWLYRLLRWNFSTA